MPYIHNDLGVPCMTITEFFAAEAKKEQKNVEDIMSEYYDSIEADQESARQDIINNHEMVLKMLQDYYDPVYNDEVTWIPTEIIRVIDASVRYSYSKSSTTVTVEVKCSDDKIRLLEYSEWQYSGSYMEPPDFESNCVEIVGD